MPPISTLFMVSLPTLLLALVWQLGLPDFESFGQAILNHPTVQSILSQFIVKNYCYESILTLSNLTKVDCFKIEDGRFKYVYLDETPVDMRKLERPRSGHVIPGLWDGHGHLIQYGESLESVDLFGANSMKEVQHRLLKYKKERPETGTSDQWLRGVGWDQANYKGEWPVSGDLEIDKTFKDLYVMLDRVDVHCIWVSNKVLSLLHSDIGNIPGGEIPAKGIFCDNAMDIVLEKYPKPGPEAKTKFIKNGMRELNKFGIVGVHDAGVIPSELKLYRKLWKDDDWTIRVNAMVECAERNTFCPREVSKLSDAIGKLRIRSVKLFADGALGSWGSAMIEPYSDKPASSGSLLVNTTKLTQLTHDWAKAGYQVNIHAIGDLANRFAIDAFEATLKSLCPSEWEMDDLKECQQKHYRFRIEHAQIIHPDDQRRMLELGIIPSIQPTHATSDMGYAESRLGKSRTATEAYRMRSLLPLNPVLGSDFPVEPSSIFEGIYAAMTRRSPKTGRDPSGGTKGWYPEETLGFEEALKGFTLNPAFGAFLERKAGVIQMGAYADWVVLDAPLESMDVESLRKATVRETWVGGKMVYQRPIPV